MTSVNNSKIEIGLKILMILFFLAIKHPGGTLTLSTILWIIVGMVGHTFDLLCINCGGSYFFPLFGLFLCSSVLSSMFLIFSKKRFIVIDCLLIQCFYLSLSFKYEYLEYTYYTIPIILYFLFCLILLNYIYLEHFKKKCLQMNPK